MRGPKPAEKLTPHKAPVSVARLITSALLLVLWTNAAQAHTVGQSMAGFGGGVLHPLTGLDHMLAMICVGVWGVELGGAAIWLLPIAFPMVMAVGGAAGVMDIPLPGGELLIALSVVVLGILVALARALPLAAALLLIGLFAFAHGHAHGTELPGSADALGFTIGFVLATGLLHFAGIGIGLLARLPGGVVVTRVCGGLVALAGAYFVMGYVID